MKPVQARPFFLGVGGAILASLCCATPVLLVAVGLATSSFVLAWLNLKPIFFALAAVFLVAGLAVSLVRSRRACSVRTFRRRLWLYPVLTVASFGVGYWLLMGMFTPGLYSRVYASDASSVARLGVVREPNGQIVPLHRATFKIYMGCEGCASTLRTVFLGLPGVHAAAINTHLKNASVLYDPTRINERKIQAKIPYPWYYTPHLQGDVAMVAGTVSTTQPFQLGTILALLAALAGLLSLTSAVVWSSGVRRPVWSSHDGLR